MTLHGKWSQEGVPHKGWTCVDVSDMGEPSHLCEMCELQEVRYVHTMEHAGYPNTLDVGCVCAGNMESDYDAAKRRETIFRRKQKQFLRSNSGIIRSAPPLGYSGILGEVKMSILGFPTKSEDGSGGDFMPIVKYDARSGRIFRVDRVNNGDGFASELIDITAIFKAIFDFETVQTGWMLFAPGQAPSLALVPLNPDNQMPLPERPSPNHKHGTKTTIMLSKACGGDKPVREIAGTSTSYVSAYEQLYSEYRAEKHKYPSKLPVVVLVSTRPVTTGSGQRSSTNYRPVWRIDGWKARPDDLPREIRTPSMAIVEPLAPPMAADDFDTPRTAPRTGAQPVPPPNRVPAQVPTNLDDDFG